MRPVRVRASFSTVWLRLLIAIVFGSWHGGSVSNRAWNIESFTSLGHHKHRVPWLRHIFINCGKISVVSLPVRWRWNSEFDDFHLPQQYRAVADAILGGTDSLRRHVDAGSALFAIIWRAVVPIALSPDERYSSCLADCIWHISSFVISLAFRC